MCTIILSSVAFSTGERERENEEAIVEKPSLYCHMWDDDCAIVEKQQQQQCVCVCFVGRSRVHLLFCATLITTTTNEEENPPSRDNAPLESISASLIIIIIWRQRGIGRARAADH